MKYINVIAILLAAIAVFWSLSQNIRPQPTEISISDVIAMSEQHQIKSIAVEGDKLTVTKTDSSEVIAFKETNAVLTDYKEAGLDLTGVDVSVKDSAGINWGTILINFLPLVFWRPFLSFHFVRSYEVRAKPCQALRLINSRYVR
jgi:ATP-dependent Zn protease